MDKDKILSDLRSAVSAGIIKKSDVESILGVGERPSVVKRISVSEIFYYIGGLIIMIGLIILVGQNWNDFSHFLKSFITFGAGLAFFVSAIFLNKTATLNRLANVFFIISAILEELGFYVIFGPYVNSTNSNFFNILIPLILLIQYGVTQYFTKKDIFTIFNTIFATSLFFTVTNTIMSWSRDEFTVNFHIYRVMLVAISYLFIGHFLDLKSRLFSAMFNSVGIVGLLGTSFALNIMAGGNYALSLNGDPQTSAVWLFLYPLILVATLIGSVWIKKSSWLFFGVLFLIGYIIRITAEYFSDVVGWPIALIFLGIVIIGLGYLAFKINRKYIKSTGV